MRSSKPVIKYSLAVVLFFVFLDFYAQENSLPDTNGSFYAISVKNLDKAVEWYATHLNFKIDSEAENDERKGVLMNRKGCILELSEFNSAIDKKELRPDIESHEIYGIFKIGFLTENIEQSFNILKDSGVEIFFPIVKLPNGKRTFGIKDLEGNTIQFFGK